jgi:cellulose 1,4-beta-cellobiosidase
MYRAVTALSFANLVLGQLAGTQTAEKHPSLPIQVCTASGCTKESTSVVLDVSNDYSSEIWRGAH